MSSRAKPLCYRDTELLSRFPVGSWFFAGPYGAHPSKMRRLVRLGLLRRERQVRFRGAAWRYWRAR